MAQKTYNSVVYWRKSGIGILPGIVIKTRLEQQLDGTLAEVLTLLYAHPDDEGVAHHQANDVGDVAFSVYPLRDKTDTLPAVSFGWADTLEAFDPKPEPVAEPEPIAPVDPPAPPVVVDTNPAGAVVPAPVVIDPIAEPPVDTVVEGSFGLLDVEGGVLPTAPPKKTRAKKSVEVFADPEGRTIGIPDGDGGYANIRDNPFPPQPSDEDLTGKPLPKTN